MIRILVLMILCSCSGDAAGLPDPTDAGDDQVDDGDPPRRVPADGGLVDQGPGAEVNASDARTADDAGAEVPASCDPVTSSPCPEGMKCSFLCPGWGCTSAGPAQLGQACIAYHDQDCAAGLACGAFSSSAMDGSTTDGKCFRYCRTNADCSGRICRPFAKLACDRSELGYCS